MSNPHDHPALRRLRVAKLTGALALGLASAGLSGCMSSDTSDVEALALEKFDHVVQDACRRDSRTWDRRLWHAVGRRRSGTAAACAGTRATVRVTALYVAVTGKQEPAARLRWRRVRSVIRVRRALDGRAGARTPQEQDREAQCAGQP